MLTATAIAYFEGQSRLAEKLAITPSAVSQWGELVPPLQARRLHELTDGDLPYDPADYAGKYPENRFLPPAVEAH